MADEGNDKAPLTVEVPYVRKIDQHADGKTFYFTGTLVFKDGLLIEKRAGGSQVPLRPITEPGPPV